MSKFGWDLPPGVTTNMLPGNSAQDQADEALAERIWDVLEPLRSLIISRYPTPDPLRGLTDEDEKIHENVEMELFKVVADGYAKGYDDCKCDEAMERAALAADKEPI